MSNFTFRLKTLLRVREDERDERRLRLADALEHDAIVGQRQSELDRRRRELLARRREAAAPGELDVERLIECRCYEQLLAAEHDQLETKRCETIGQIDQRRESLLAADREVRVLDKLEEKQRQRHCDEHQRHEVKRLDEIAATARNG